MPERNLEQDGIAVDSYEDASGLQRILVENGYATMITKEEHLWVVNWVWCDSGFADRNDVIFINRADFETQLWRRDNT